MTVMVDDLLIEDGDIRPPAVGDVVTLPLRFLESAAGQGSSGEDSDVTGSVSINASLERQPGDPVWQYPGESTPRRWEWSGLLRGDGWTAAWSGPRPRMGRVELTGRFVSILDGAVGGQVRARVTRVRIVTERMRRVGAGGMAVQPGHRRYRDVDAAPGFFERPWWDAAVDAAIAADPPAPGTQYFASAAGSLPDEFDDDKGVLIDLDLDDVPPIPSRPRMVPGDASAGGNRWWVSDTELPLVAAIEPDGTAREYVLPGPADGRRRVSATPSGCWVTGSDGVYRVTPGASPDRVGDHAIIGAVAFGETLLACGREGRWELHRPDEAPVALEAPDGPVFDAIVDGGDVVVLCGNGSGDPCLVRVTAAGVVEEGPWLRIADVWRSALIADPLRLVAGAVVYSVRPDLTLRETTRLPERPLDVGSAAGDIWITTHPPDGTGYVGWWPLNESVEFDRRADQYWLLTRLDGHSLEPVLSVPIHGTRAHVAADEDGTVRAITDGLVEVPGTTMEWPEDIDLPVLLAASDAQSVPPPD